MTDRDWIPFRAFTLLEQEMHELVERIGGRSWVDGFGWKPDTDIYRCGPAFVVQLELPGINPLRDLEINIEDNVLQISGRMVQANDVSESDRFITERRYGPFHREVMLPCGIDPASVEAAFSNGVLTIRAAWFPQTNDQEEPKRVQIGVSVDSSRGAPTPVTLLSQCHRTNSD